MAAGDSDERVRRRRSGLAVWLTVAAPSVPFYVLSSGPIVWLVDHGYVPERVGLIYLPLALIADRIPLLRPVLTWYLEL